MSTLGHAVAADGAALRKQELANVADSKYLGLLWACFVVDRIKYGRAKLAIFGEPQKVGRAILAEQM